MNGEQSGLRICQTAHEELPALTLAIHRVLDGVPRQPARADFRFDPATPMIVSVTFTPWLGSSVTWRISRELLHNGLVQESGEGDVQVWPAPCDAGRAVWLLLESKGASAVFELPAPALEEWLDATYGIVAAEAETTALDWDAFLTEVLDDRELPADD
ncbi:SsgA family sporulation/cell division regulator [Streptomyces sp. NPDC006012]|uniref:SsgA family sporulation/cell division regulator n=1 Tax=Streptomyces sp. NPDC006012 TaxID=3364739 RepID=UPI0036AA8765